MEGDLVESLRWREPTEAILITLDQIGDASGEGEGEDAVAQHCKANMNGEQQRMLQRWDELYHLIRKCCGVGEESECNTDGDCAECAESTAAIEVDCCGADAEGEGDAELVEVPPRTASNNECPCEE